MGKTRQLKNMCNRVLACKGRRAFHRLWSKQRLRNNHICIFSYLFVVFFAPLRLTKPNHHFPARTKKGHSSAAQQEVLQIHRLSGGRQKEYDTCETQVARAFVQTKQCKEESIFVQFIVFDCLPQKQDVKILAQGKVFRSIKFLLNDVN